MSLNVSEPRPSDYLSFVAPTEVFVHFVGAYVMNKCFLSRKPGDPSGYVVIGILGIIGNIFGAYSHLREFLDWNGVPIDLLEKDIWNDWTFMMLVVVPTGISSLWATYVASFRNEAISMRFKAFVILYFLTESIFASIVLAFVADDDTYHCWQWVQHFFLLGFQVTMYHAMKLKSKQIRLMKME